MAPDGSNEALGILIIMFILLFIIMGFLSSISPRHGGVYLYERSISIKPGGKSTLTLLIEGELNEINVNIPKNFKYDIRHGEYEIYIDIYAPKYIVPGRYEGKISVKYSIPRFLFSEKRERDFNIFIDVILPDDKYLLTNLKKQPFKLSNGYIESDVTFYNALNVCRKILCEFIIGYKDKILSKEDVYLSIDANCSKEVIFHISLNKIFPLYPLVVYSAQSGEDSSTWIMLLVYEAESSNLIEGHLLFKGPMESLLEQVNAIVVNPLIIWALITLVSAIALMLIYLDVESLT